MTTFFANNNGCEIVYYLTDRNRRNCFGYLCLLIMLTK